MAKYANLYDLMINSGMMEFEARTFSDKYSMDKLSEVPYIKRMLVWRRNTVRRLRKDGVPDTEIADRIKRLYAKRGWLTKSGELDAWMMLKKFRDIAIEKGEYVAPSRSHHKNKMVTDDDLRKQGSKRSVKGIQLQKREYRDAIDRLEREWRRVVGANVVDKKRKQELERQMGNARQALERLG